MMMEKKTKRKRMGSRKRENIVWDYGQVIKSYQIQVREMMGPFPNYKLHTLLFFVIKYVN